MGARRNSRGQGLQTPCPRLLVVAHTGFEPVISALRGRCPRPLDECASSQQDYSTHTRSSSQAFLRGRFTLTLTGGGVYFPTRSSG